MTINKYIHFALLIINSIYFDSLRGQHQLFNISVSSASIFHRQGSAVTKRRRCSTERATTLPSSWVNLGRNNCVLVRDRWCHFAVRNLVFHNFAIWRATCIETPQDRGDDCYMAKKGEDNPAVCEGIANWVFPVPAADRAIPSVKCRWLGHVRPFGNTEGWSCT